MLASSPITAITTSAPFAVSTACWKAASASSGVCGGFFGPGMNWSNIDGTWRRISGPGAWAIFAAGSFARRPSSTVTAAGTWPNTIHEPSVSALESARGPITARLATVFGERQRLLLVPQEHHRPLGGEARLGAVRRVGEDGGDARLVGVRRSRRGPAAP